MSVFSDEWRRCMRVHYQHVIRHNDTVTKPTLTEVLHMVGFTEAELNQLYIEATMRTEDNNPDFKPNLSLLQAMQPEPQAASHPAECQCPSCVNIDMIPHDADGQPIQTDDDDDTPEQLSLF